VLARREPVTAETARHHPRQGAVGPSRPLVAGDTPKGRRLHEITGGEAIPVPTFDVVHIFGRALDEDARQTIRKRGASSFETARLRTYQSPPIRQQLSTQRSLNSVMCLNGSPMNDQFVEFVDGHDVVTFAAILETHEQICRPDDDPAVLMPEQLAGALARPSRQGTQPTSWRH
jgi:hypothetical protein